MSTRAAAWLAWAVLALCVALAVLAMGLDIYTPPTKYEPHFSVLAGIPLLVYPTIGALVVSHRPMNAVGWVLCGMGFVLEVLAFSRAYANYSRFAPPGSLPGDKAGAGGRRRGAGDARPGNLARKLRGLVNSRDCPAAERRSKRAPAVQVVRLRRCGVPWRTLAYGRRITNRWAVGEVRSHRHRSVGVPRSRGYSDPALSSIRHRRDHQPYARLRVAYCDIGERLFRGRDGDPGSLPKANRPTGSAATRRRGLYACYRGVVHPVEAWHPVVHRPPFLPQEVRREEDTRRLLGPVARRDGPERLERRPGRSGKGDYATRTRFFVAAPR